MKNLFLLVLLVTAGSCKEAGLKNTASYALAASAPVPLVPPEEKAAVYNFDTLDLGGALVNGHPIVMSQEEFEKSYGALDSAKTDLWECGSPFGYLDDAWMAKTYGAYDTNRGEYKNFNGYLTTLFVNKASFASNGNIALFNEAGATGNTFEIAAAGIILNQNTTLEAFEKAFPKLKGYLLDSPQQYSYRLPIGAETEDAFLFEFRNGKLYSFQLWWLLC